MTQILVAFPPISLVPSTLSISNDDEVGGFGIGRQGLPAEDVDQRRVGQNRWPGWSLSFFAIRASDDASTSRRIGLD